MATVTVACKIPNGLIAEVRPEGGGPSTRVTFIGSGQARRMDSEGNVVTETANVMLGYGLTPNVDQSFWDAWVKDNADSKLVKEMMIFAMPKAEATRDAARDVGTAVKTGLEALDPNRPPKGIEKADRKAA